MKVYDALILDDEQQSNELLKHFLETYCPNVRLVGAYTNVEDAYAKIISCSQLILFLDIELGAHQSGFELVELIANRNDKIIIVSGHSNYAIKAFRYEITDFLMKPVKISELVEAVNRCIRQVEMSENGQPFAGRMGFQLYNRVEFIELNSILYFKADVSMTDIRMTKGRSLESTWRIGEIEERLNPKLFVRVHKSYLVNKHLVKSIIHKGAVSFLEMADGSMIPIARRKKKSTYTELDI